MIQRLNGLDYLRGLAAFGVMIFHYTKTIMVLDANMFLTRVGYYGVSIFYILSGYTLAYVYKNKVSGSGRLNLRNFFSKRIARIFLLLYLAIFLTVVLRKGNVHLYEIIINIPGLFSVLEPSAYIAPASWSIGNELFFYLLLPILLYCIYKTPCYFYLILFISFCVFIYFSFEVLPVTFGTVEHWKNYINPLNQAFYFIIGFYLSTINLKFKKDSLTFIVIIAAFCIFSYYRINGAEETLVHGFNRLVFSFLAIVLVWAFASIKLKNHVIDKVLSYFGDISYSVYLLHLLVLSITNTILNRIEIINLNDYLKMSLSILFTIVVLHLSFFYYEQYTRVKLIRILSKK